MTTIFVWVLVLQSWHGGVVIYDNIANQESCERMLARAKVASPFNSRSASINGTCTQVAKFVQLAPGVNVSPDEIKVPPTQVRGIKEKK